MHSTHKKTQQIIGANIRHRRKLLGLSLKALGAQLGITYQQMQKYETGMNLLSCDKLVELARFFDCSLDALCDGVIAGTETPKRAEDAYRVRSMLAYFCSIDSRSARDQLCGVVRLVAELSAVR